MPTHQNVIDSNEFWTAPESYIFPLPIVAIALSIGRNKMCQIPVIPIMIDKRKCYKKSDILNWAIAEQEKGKDNLLFKLKAESSSIGKAEKVKSQFYDYYLSKSDGSYYRPSSLRGEIKHDKFYRLEKEWRDIRNQLSDCKDNEELKKLIKLAWEYREQFIKLRMGLRYDLVLNNWWFEKDFDAVLAARLLARQESLKWRIEDEKQSLDDLIKNGLPSYVKVPKNIDASVLINKIILSKKQDIDQLSAELKELG